MKFAFLAFSEVNPDNVCVYTNTQAERPGPTLCYVLKTIVFGTVRLRRRELRTCSRLLLMEWKRHSLRAASHSPRTSLSIATSCSARPSLLGRGIRHPPLTIFEKRSGERSAFWQEMSGQSVAQGLAQPESLTEEQSPARHTVCQIKVIRPGRAQSSTDMLKCVRLS